MPIFYRGAGIGTYWHQNDARLSGFTPHNPGMPRSHTRLMMHIAKSTTHSPYVSLSRSYGVALEYALSAGRAIPTAATPAYVYEVELDDPLPLGLLLLDPISEVAKAVPSPLGAPYQHDGAPRFLIGVVDPIGQQQFLQAPCPRIPGATVRPANLSIELETLVRALRDAEILAVGTIPASQVTNRLDVF